MDSKTLRELVETAPLILLTLKDKKLLDEVDNMLPYSIGFEIECGTSDTYIEDDFKFIPDIMNANCYKNSGEHRFRIPNGLRGIICLSNICDKLKTNLLLNYGSGIHYHVDCTDYGGVDALSSITRKNEDWILEELDKWGYTGTYNSRATGYSGSWVKFNTLDTLEFRIGEMSFDYKVLIKRILHCSSIVKRLKDQLSSPIIPKFQEIDKEGMIKYLRNSNLDINTYGKLIQNRLLEAEKELKKLVAEPPITEDQKISEIVKNRVHKIN